MSLTSLTAVELAKKIKSREVTVLEATEAALLAIERREKEVHSFVTVDAEGAKKRAKRGTEADRRRYAERTACGRSCCNKRQFMYEGSADDLQLKDFK